MKWDALDLQSERIWTLTPDETKAKRQHLVPLTEPALSIIEEQPVLGKGEYVFTATGSRSVTGFGRAKQELDKIVSDMVVAAGRKPMPAWRLHDLRRTVATHMEDALGIPPHVVGSILNHDPKGYKGITATYTRGSLLYERRRALTAWARLLDLIIDEHVWVHVERLIRPETEMDAIRTDEFRRMIASTADIWSSYLSSLIATDPKTNVHKLRRKA